MTGAQRDGGALFHACLMVGVGAALGVTCLVGRGAVSFLLPGFPSHGLLDSPEMEDPHLTPREDPHI